MTTSEWYENLKSVLPRQFAREMEREFEDSDAQIADNPKDFVNRVTDFINENIGKCSKDPLSVKVYAVIDGRSEAKTFREFVEKGY